MNIKISKNSHHCAACGHDFQHGQSITSTVKKAEGALQREDYCRDCLGAEQNKEAYSVWSVVYHDPRVESEEPPEVFSPLRQLFYEAVEEQSRLEMAKAFLAAGLLRRQKVFRLIRDSGEDGGGVRVTLYADRIGNRLIEVPDPQFTYPELESARTLLVERLQALEAAAMAPAADAPAAPDAAAVEAEDDAAVVDPGEAIPTGAGGMHEDDGEEEEFDDEDEEDDEDEDEFDDEDEDEFDEDDDDDEDEDEDDEDDDEDVIEDSDEFEDSENDPGADALDGKEEMLHAEA